MSVQWRAISCKQGVVPLLLLAAVLGLTATLPGVEVTLKSGMRLKGQIADIAGIGADPLAAKGAAGKPIMLVDDGLRRTFVSVHQRDSVAPDTSVFQGIEIPQKTARGGRAISSVGQILGATAFDKWGRRKVRLRTPRGDIDVIQGITEITPVYTQVEGLLASRSFDWNMRLATSSIDRATLSSVLYQALDKENANDRRDIVSFYAQSQRYQDAADELDRAIADFPQLEKLQELKTLLRQLKARQMVREIRVRQGAGQHQFVRNLLANFPSQDIARDVLLEVQELAQQYQQSDAQKQQIISLLDENVTAIEDQGLRARIKPIHTEIAEELNLNNLNRMADFLRLADDDSLASDQKVSLAISGWLLGAGSGLENIAVSLSLAEVRELVRRYLWTRPEDLNLRTAILEQLAGLEGSAPPYVDKLLKSMKPPRDPRSRSAAGPEEGTAPNEIAKEDEVNEQASESVPGLYSLTTPGLEPGDPVIEYLVQLPPEYDPYRRYPTVVTLHAAGTNAEKQVDWWAGAHAAGADQRHGQATRHGYIVVAPRWIRRGQRRYGYSAHEHAAVLSSLRDACQRFSVDTDRVFLSGHSMGGDAAWDIGLAHPDLWAGVIPIVAVAYQEDPSSPQYLAHYWPNAKHVPLYFVSGEKDGGKLQHNAKEFDRYLRRSGYDTMVVAFIGRGHEHFYDEIHRLFEWMGFHERDFLPREFTCMTMRPWDSFFWWAELDHLPSQSMVVPLAWPPQRRRAVEIQGRLRERNSILLRSGAGQSIVWLTPEMMDFEQRLTIDVDGRREKTAVSPSTDVILEDARTRGDRQHPFWAKVEIQGRRR